MKNTKKTIKTFALLVMLGFTACYTSGCMFAAGAAAGAGAATVLDHEDDDLD